MADKTKGVMDAIKGRKGVAPKKSAALVGIMAKLTAKRESAKEDRGEKAEGSKEAIKDGKGGIGDAAKAAWNQGVGNAAQKLRGVLQSRGIKTTVGQSTATTAPSTPAPSTGVAAPRATTRDIDDLAKAKQQAKPAPANKADSDWKRISNGQLNDSDMKKKPGTVFK